ncbi:hypothetical protein O9929_00565 [Vibrio lentus]|nr:hypothetical protein [Vibrio lentus]
MATKNNTPRLVTTQCHLCKLDNKKDTHPRWCNFAQTFELALMPTMWLKNRHSIAEVWRRLSKPHHPGITISIRLFFQPPSGDSTNEVRGQVSAVTLWLSERPPTGACVVAHECPTALAKVHSSWF